MSQYAPCVILEALIFAENLGNALPSIVCETKIAWQLNQSCTLPEEVMFVVLHRGARKVSLLEIKSRWKDLFMQKTYRP